MNSFLEGELKAGQGTVQSRSKERLRSKHHYTVELLLHICVIVKTLMNILNSFCETKIIKNKVQ